MSRIAIASDRLSAEIAPLGAELQSLKCDGEELLWSGDPAWWAGRAPILFPMIGRLPDGRYRLDGREYALAKHGFARRSRFAVVEQTLDAATFRLQDDAETRAAWPFPFRLDLRFAIAAARLEITATVANTGDRDMPFSFGFHPAFRWPLPGAGARDRHVMRFAEPEPVPIRRAGPDGLLTSASHPTPVADRTLELSDALFSNDAIIMPDIASRSLDYGVPGRSGLRIGWDGLPDLGIWMKPGADYVCVEPWAGYPAPEGFADELWDKPGIMRLAPGEERRFTMWVEPAASV